MAGFKLTKGSYVEVSSDEPGFHGAWYVAILVDVLEAASPKSSTSKKKKKMKYVVRYETLYEEDNTDEHLTEIVNPRFVRPLPPRNVRQDIQRFDVVDAFRRDGWWIGVVKEVVVTNDGEEISKYVVSFENPNEEVEFDRSQLRLHVDWVDSHWHFPSKIIMTPDQDLAAIHASKSNNAHLGFTTPPSKGGGSVKRKIRSQKKSNSRNAKTRSSRKRENVNSAEEDSRGKTAGSDHGNTKGMVSILDTSRSQAIHQDSILVEEVNIEVSEAKDGKSNSKRKRGRPPKLQVKRPNGSLKGTKKNAGRNLNFSASHETPTDLNEQTLSDWYQGLLPSSVLKKSSYCCPCDKTSGSLNQQTIAKKGGTTITTATDYHQGWPFIKQSPIWATIDSLVVHQTFTRKPHFSPLKKVKEDFREGLAIALMVTYANLIHKISKFQTTDSVYILNNSLKTLVILENHGFDVISIRARLSELVSLKSQLGEHKDKKEITEKELEKLEHNKSVIEKEMIQLKLKLQELQEKKVQSVEEIMRLQSNLGLVSSKIIDCDLAFEKVAATPL